jgi:hypothetical protein
VDVPIKLSQILYQFGDGVGNQPTRWIPLVLALELVGEQRTYPAPEMFKNFVSRIRG